MKISVEKHILLNLQDYASIDGREEKSHASMVWRKAILKFASTAAALPRGSVSF